MARICHFLAGSSFGGGTYVARKICERLVMLGHQTTVVSCDPETARFFAGTGCEVAGDVVVRREISPLEDLAGVLSLARVLRRQKCDLLHTHTSKGGVVGRLAGKIAGVRRIVHHVHGFAFDPLFTPPRKARFYAAIERLVAPLGDAMIFVNRTDLDLARSLGIVKNGRLAVIVANGVDVPAPRQRPSEDGGLRPVQVGFLGRLAQQKGVDILIEAVARMDRSCPVEVLVVGDGAERNRLQSQAARMGLGDRVRFLGHRQDALQAIAAVDVIALPSRWEGHSISLLECMALGKAIVATRIKGNVETIVDGCSGLLVEPGEPGELCSALERLARDAELRLRLSEQARRTVEEKFLSAAMIDGVLDVYRKLGIS